MKKSLSAFYQIIKNRLTTRGSIVYLLFVLLSFALWYFYSLRVQREVNIKLPVTFVSADSAIIFKSEVPQYINVMISDYGYRLRKLSGKTLSLEIPVSSHNITSRGLVDINFNELSQYVASFFPEYVSIKNIEPRSIQFSYVALRKREVPITLNALFEPLPQHWFSCPPQLVQNKISIEGPAHIVNAITSIGTVNRTYKLSADTSIVHLPLVIPDSVTLYPNAVDVKVCTEMFTEQKFVLPVHVVEVPKQQNIRTFPSKVQVIVKVATRHFDNIREEDFIVQCAYPKEERTVLPITVLHNNPFVIQVKSVPQQVEYIIEKK